VKKYPDRHRKVPSRKVGVLAVSAFEPVHSTGDPSLKGLAVPRQSRSRRTTRRRRFAYAVSWLGPTVDMRSLNQLVSIQIARSIHMRLESRTSHSHGEVAELRSNKRRLVRQDGVRMLIRAELRRPLQRFSRQPHLKNQISTQSRLRFKTLRLNKRLIPLYSFTTPRRNSHLSRPNLYKLYTNYPPLPSLPLHNLNLSK